VSNKESKLDFNPDYGPTPITNPAVSAQLAQSFTGEVDVCVNVLDPENMEALAELRFSDPKALKDVVELLRKFVDISRYASKHGFERAMDYYQLDAVEFDELDINEATDRILEEGL